MRLLQIKTPRLSRNQSGFTILELMIATMIFSVILLLCTYGVIQIGNTFYKGGVLVRTQNANRRAMDAISTSVQYGGEDLSGLPIAGLSGQPLTTGDGVFCVGKVRFMYSIGTRVTGSTHGLVVDNEGTGCPLAATNDPSDDKELLGEGMRITRFSLQSVGPPVLGPDQTETIAITLAVAYGDDDALDADGLCRGGPDSRFCANSDFTTTVQRRL